MPSVVGNQLKDLFGPDWLTKGVSSNFTSRYNPGGNTTGSISAPGFSMTWPEVPTVTNPAYTPNPSPTEGLGPFGKVPGPVGLPDPYANLSALYPNLGESNKAASKFALSEMMGQLSPETQSNLWDIGARFGQTSGMPGSGLAKNRTARDLGLATEQLQRAGLQDYLNAIFGIAKTQTVSPELQASIATQNAEKSAAPSPPASQTYAQSLYNSYLNRASPAGGTGSFSGPNIGGVPFIMHDYEPSLYANYKAPAETTPVPQTASAGGTPPALTNWLNSWDEAVPEFAGASAQDIYGIMGWPWGG